MPQAACSPKQAQSAMEREKEAQASTRLPAWGENTAAGGGLKPYPVKTGKRGRKQAMCGRYEIVDGERIFVRFGVTNDTPKILANLDVRPTQQVPVLLTDHRLQLMQWGLIPSWAKDPSIGHRTILNIRTAPYWKPDDRRGV
jgi:SOS response associated peptidase (SRAP)